MKRIKSERLKKLEAELEDLQQWQKLGLVPKKDLPKHEEEIRSLSSKIDEELERLQFLRESGELEDVPQPKRGTGRTAFTEMSTLPDVDLTEAPGSGTDSMFNQNTEEHETRTKTTTQFASDDDDSDSEETTQFTDSDDEEEESESYFSDRNRWKRGGIVDPDSNDW